MKVSKKDLQTLRQTRALSFFKLMGFFVVLSQLTSCLVDSPQNGNGSTRGAQGASFNNGPDTVSTNFGRILEDNPIVLSGNANLSPNVDLSSLLNPRQEYITDKQFLEGECFSVTGICFDVKKDEVTPKFISFNRKWAYQPPSTEFLQVSTFGHLKRIISRYTDIIQDVFYNRTSSAQGPGFLDYTTSIPTDYITSGSHWRGLALTTHADSGIEDNAFYNSAAFQIGLGQDSVFPQVKFGHDSTVIYHEIGHALNDIMINTRNRSGPRASMGYVFYDEAGAINEGIADYYSFVMNGRTHFGEWALGRFIKQSRPMSEADPAHASGINTSTSGRLAYPTYVNYDPNFPEAVVEDIHYAGQIISHYLVALTQMIQSKCSMGHAQSTAVVVHLLLETFSELGDLTAFGSDYNPPNQVNLNSNTASALDGLNSLTWLRINNPMNFRKFAQTMAKYQYEIYGNPNMPRCNGAVLEKDDIERLLDNYGLLLFRTYNLNKNAAGSNPAVSSLNRVKTQMVNKNALRIDQRQGNPQAFVFDDRSTMINVLSQLNASGQLQDSISTQIEADLPFNNGNSRISPGEFLGLSLNLFNNSNSTIAGVEVIANDWDHVRDGKMCNDLGDNFPSVSEGGISGGDCLSTTTDNGGDGDEIAPVCFIQKISGDATEWISQSSFKNSLAGMADSQCLAGSSNLKNCFVRFPRGADRAVYSRIESQKSFGETIVNEDGSPSFNFSNLLFMEVNKNTPPGTTFNCRFRARFSNCDDCYHDPNNAQDDYVDAEFAGAKPFKIINFQFTVID